MSPPRIDAALSAKARRHLSRRDPVLKQVAARVGACTLVPDGDCFGILARSIVSQLISTAAARTIGARLLTALGDAGLTPAGLVALGEEKLRGCGLSGAKAKALLDLAGRAQSGVLPLARLPVMEDAEVEEHLTAVRGIGVWTAQMFLIFCLGRPDVLPVGDLGLRAGVKDQYGLDELPSAKNLVELAAPWRPYRSIATWYLWRSRGGVPQSD